MLRIVPTFSCRLSAWGQGIGAALMAVALLSLGITVVRAQQPPSNSAGASDLTRQNLSRVAASPEEIKAVLAKDAGLMVALKQWVARDAAEHGQVVSDSDLADDGIFQRLEMDIAFRSVATALLQRFGYLVPKINPESDSGKEHELALQERARRLAELRQDQGLVGARWQGAQTENEQRACDLQADNTCAFPPARSRDLRAPREDSPVAEPPVTSPQAERDPTLRAGLALPEDAAGTAYTPLPLTAYDSTPTFQSLDVRASTEPDSQASLARLPGSGRISPTQNGLAPSEDGLLPAYALGAGSGVANLPDVTAGGASAASSPLTVPGVPALAAPPLRPLASPLVEPPEMVRKKNPYESIPSLYDMYVQAVARPPEPRRFGAEVFESAARDSQAIPMDLPAARTM